MIEENALRQSKIEVKYLFQIAKTTSQSHLLNAFRQFEEVLRNILTTRLRIKL